MTNDEEKGPWVERKGLSSVLLKPAGNKEKRKCFKLLFVNNKEHSQKMRNIIEIRKVMSL